MGWWERGGARAGLCGLGTGGAVAAEEGVYCADESGDLGGGGIGIVGEVGGGGDSAVYPGGAYLIRISLQYS